MSRRWQVIGGDRASICYRDYHMSGGVGRFVPFRMIENRFLVGVKEPKQLKENFLSIYKTAMEN